MSFIKLFFITAVLYSIAGFINKLKKNGTKFPNYFIAGVISIIGFALTSLIVKVDAQQIDVKATPTRVYNEELQILKYNLN